MTREETRDAVKVMEAYANGKKIQYLDNNNKWIDAHNPVFDWYNCDYRIKPEPKYRPFQTQEECWKEMHKHSDFGWVRCKYTGNFASIGNISEKKDKKLFITWATNEGYSFLASDVFNDYTFTDGEPFGIKEE